MGSLPYGRFQFEGEEKEQPRHPKWAIAAEVNCYRIDDPKHGIIIFPLRSVVWRHYRDREDFLCSCLAGESVKAWLSATKSR